MTALDRFYCSRTSPIELLYHSVDENSVDPDILSILE